MRKRIVAATAIAIFISCGASADNLNKSCGINDCPAGTKVVTYATKTDRSYSCPTKELAEYTNFVLSLVSATFNFTGQLPNISPTTGEPEFTGKTKEMVDARRIAANVSTYGQAVAACREVKGGLRLVIINNHPNDLTVWALNEKTQAQAWYSKGALDLR